MAITENKYTGDGSSVLYSFTFPYLEVTDIKVSLDGVDTTAYTLANATQIRFNTAPANGAAIRLYRQTDDENLAATFFPGSAIRAKDLNDNFTQNLYVTQESSRDAAQGIATADAATATANTALNNSSAAVSTANAASASAAAAVSTANTASSNSSAAVSTANTASSNASAAVNTANSAATDAATAISTANGAVTTANSAAADAATAISTANTASSNASTAVNTANTASTNASNAVTTANTASTTASNAVTTANSAVTTANAAVVTANAADSKANQAIAAVAVALLFDIVPNVAAIPGSPQDGDAVEVTDATGIESFTPLSNLPAGFVGDAGLSARIIYNAGGATWNWLNYFANNPDDRYAGPNTDAGTAALPSIAFGPTDRDTGIYSPGAGQVAVATDGAQRITVDASGRLLVGTSTARTNFYNTTFSSQFQVEGNPTAAAQFSLTSTFNGSNGPNLIFGKHRSGSPGGNAIVQNNDNLGVLSFQGADNSEQVEGASIQAFVDGTPGANSMPGRLAFSTTAAGASTPTERLRIGSTGAWGLSGTNYGTSGQVLTSSGSGSAPTWTTVAPPDASTAVKGIVQLSTATNSTSTTLAATPSAVKSAYDLAASKTSNTGTVTSVATSGALTGGTITTSGTLSVRSGTTSQTGVVQLSTATNSTSTTLAATASAAKAAYDRGTTGVTNAATAQSTANTANTNASSAISRTNGGWVQAWCYFNASSGAPSLSSNHNVSSITDRGTGLFTINYSSTIATNYSFQGTCGDDTSSNASRTVVIQSLSTSNTQIKTVFTNSGSASPVDIDHNCVLVIRN